MIYEIVWMGIGAGGSWVATHLYHNNKFQQAVKEEVAKAKSKVTEIRAEVKKAL